MRLVTFGNGRVGANVAHYARHLGHHVDLLDRAAATDRARTAALVGEADLVAVALPDAALKGWLDDWRGVIAGRRVIHFSGATRLDGVAGYHPLYSFPRTLLPVETLARIGIARDRGAPPFAAILPGATNPEIEIDPQDRAYYHALAVLTGNFAAHLWNRAAGAFETRLGAAAAPLLAPYLRGVVDRFEESPTDSLTGPVARRDRDTVLANLQSLDGEPALKALYEVFLRSAWPDF